MKKIGSYVNGNTVVVIYDDGTKARYTKAGENPLPEFPESMDLKITNRCDMRCEFCAENSVPIGTHGDLNDPILKTIRPYTELAIGGGNPLEHPELVKFLEQMKKQKVICNLTVNARHFLKHRYFLKVLTEEKLIYGLGISVPNEVPNEFEKAEEFPNAVIHTIAGYTPMSVYNKLAGHNLNLLILGYKFKGRGGTYLDSIHNLENTTGNLRALSKRVIGMRPAFKAIAFDNLAVKQLKLKDKLSKEEYEKLYMGDDGEFTMYIDMVQKKFAASSTHTLYSINASTVEELFHEVKLQKEINKNG